MAIRSSGGSDELSSQQITQRVAVVIGLTVALALGISAISSSSSSTRTSDITKAVSFLDPVANALFNLAGRFLDPRIAGNLRLGYRDLIRSLASLGPGIAVVGFVLLFLGYKLYQIILAIPGFLIGGAVGIALVGGVSNILEFIVVIFCALIGAGIVLALYALGLFLTGFLVGFSLWMALTGAHDANAMAFIAGVVGGILLLVLHKALIVLITCAYGATLACAGLGQNYPLALFLFLCSGIFVQYHSDRQARARPAPEKQKRKRDQVALARWFKDLSTPRPEQPAAELAPPTTRAGMTATARAELDDLLSASPTGAPAPPASAAGMDAAARVELDDLFAQGLEGAQPPVPPSNADSSTPIGAETVVVPGAGASTDEGERQSRYSVILIDSGWEKINVIKAVRALTNLGLAEAKALVDNPSASTPVLANLTKEAAEEARRSLEAAGAAVVVSAD
jgi:large subunit ribosomal protein L7/L12